MLDPLAELGLDPSVDHSRAAVKKRYREMAMRYHPDKNPGDAAAEERFKKISAAYQILTDPRAKAEWEARTRSEEDARRSRDEYHFSQGRDPFESRFATGFGGGGMGCVLRKAGIPHSLPFKLTYLHLAVPLTRLLGHGGTTTCPRTVRAATHEGRSHSTISAVTSSFAAPLKYLQR